MVRRSWRWVRSEPLAASSAHTRQRRARRPASSRGDDRMPTDLSQRLRQCLRRGIGENSTSKWSTRWTLNVYLMPRRCSSFYSIFYVRVTRLRITDFNTLNCSYLWRLNWMDWKNGWFSIVMEVKVYIRIMFRSFYRKICYAIFYLQHKANFVP